MFKKIFFGCNQHQGTHFTSDLLKHTYIYACILTIKKKACPEVVTHRMKYTTHYFLKKMPVRTH